MLGLPCIEVTGVLRVPACITIVFPSQPHNRRSLLLRKAGWLSAVHSA
jgi:hypothetical protein